VNLRDPARLTRFIADRGVDHDESARRIDENLLATISTEHEHPLLSGQEPNLIAVAPERPRGTGSEVRLVNGHTRGVLKPGTGNKLPAAPVPVVGQQQAKSRIVAQHGVEATVGHLLAGAVDEPRCVRFGPHRLPDLFVKVLGDRPPDRAA